MDNFYFEQEEEIQRCASAASDPTQPTSQISANANAQPSPLQALVGRRIKTKQTVAREKLTRHPHDPE